MRLARRPFSPSLRAAARIPRPTTLARAPLAAELWLGTSGLTMPLELLLLDVGWPAQKGRPTRTPTR